MPRCSSALALVLLLAACAAEPPPAWADAEAGSVQRVPVQGLELPQRLAEGAVLTAAWELRSQLPITGLSAMALDGERLLLGTDQGDLLETSCPLGQPLTECAEEWRFDGRLVARGSPRADLEALAIRPDGSVVLGLENMPRLALLEGEPGDYRIGRLEGAPDLRFLDRNAGPEAVAALPDGRLLTIPEGAVEPDGRALVLLQDKEGNWQRHWLRLPAADLLPVEATVAGGHLFVLLRRFGLLSGWRGEILALPLHALDEPGDTFTPRTIATIRHEPLGDNHEAMAVRQLPDGSYSLLVASDDNGFALQRRLLLAFTWQPSSGGGMMGGEG
ncbi:esterase-like activity of phytase family protein [Geminicoccus harenae]|uniref:esterase-like activity of phytase family protein n=1 Tax=Geminicoccus harenae TaxID=2498453 RepID=UPI00168B3778|nr:esterase-like activity of phytase family protein [Geminicoccus harenae]